MIKYILVGGYIRNASDKGRAFCEELVKDFEKKPVKILDCIFARPVELWQKILEEDKVFMSEFVTDFDLELADPDIFVEQVKRSDVVFLRGGFTKVLMDMLSKNADWINYLDGKVVAGSSAGGEVIAKYYHVLTTNRKGDGFGLVPIKFIPHWKSSNFDDADRNLDWGNIIKELKEYKDDFEILTLSEGEFRIFNI